MTKKERARLILDVAHASGTKISLSNFGVVFTPPPDVSVIMEAAKLGNELAEIVRAEPRYVTPLPAKE